MTFAQAVESAFRNALTFSGRSRRPEYWWFFLFVFAGALVIGAIEYAALGGSQWLTRLFQLVVLLPFLAVAWRRLQDTGRPGWMVLIPSAIVMVSAVIAGSVTRQMMGQLVDTPGAMHAPGAVATGIQSGVLLVLSLLQIIAGVVIIWWMSRPSQRGPNAYGPEPRVR